MAPSLLQDFPAQGSENFRLCLKKHIGHSHVCHTAILFWWGTCTIRKLVCCKSSKFWITHRHFSHLVLIRTDLNPVLILVCDTFVCYLNTSSPPPSSTPSPTPGRTVLPVPPQPIHVASVGTPSTKYFNYNPRKKRNTSNTHVTPVPPPLPLKEELQD